METENKKHHIILIFVRSFNAKLKTQPAEITEKKPLSTTQQEFTILRMSQTNLQLKSEEENAKHSSENVITEPVVVMDEFPSELDVSKLMDKIMTKKRFAGASSIFIVVPTSDDEAEHTRRLNSATSFRSSESPFTSISTNHVSKGKRLSLYVSYSIYNQLDTKYYTKDYAHIDSQDLTSKRGLKVCGKSKRFYMRELSSSDETQSTGQNESRGVLKYVKKTNNEVRRVATPNKDLSMVCCTSKRKQGIAIDTTEDRPCCCQIKKSADALKTNISKSRYLKGKVF